MTGLPEFESRDQVLTYFKRKHPIGTPFEEIALAGPCHKAGSHLTLTLPAPGHVATRHFIGDDGTPGSMAVPQDWVVEFHFDANLTLCRIEVEMVSATRSGQ